MLSLQDWPNLHPARPIDSEIEARIDTLIAGMSLARKVGQVVQADISAVTPEDVAAYHLGSILNGGNSAPDAEMRSAPADWLALADAFWHASVGEDGSGIPVIWGTDAVHGNNNVVGSTIFPHNVGLGAANDEGLMRRIGRATALEMRAVGIEWTFAPTLAVTRDDRWGRTYESYSESPDTVARLGAALVTGLQGDPSSTEFLGPNNVIATAKHFIGDGGTRDGRDQGETEASEAEMRDIHAAGYVSTLQAGVQSVMASFSSWQGHKMHGSRDFLTDLLKKRWRFDGFVVGDWNGHGQLPGCSETDAPDALLAGLDMYMAPDSWRELIGNLTRQVQTGRIPMARLDDAVRRILRVKARLGVLGGPKPSARAHAGEFGLLGREDHVRLADEAVRKSAVLLKNSGGLLPLRPGLNVLVVGEGADDIGMACGGWSLSWQGGGLTKQDFPHALTMLDTISRIVGQGGGKVTYSEDGSFSDRPDVVIAVYGEPPYAEFRGDLDTLDFSTDGEREAVRLRRLKAAGIPVVSVFLSGRPRWVNPEMNASDAFVAAFLPGTRAGALADLLFADATGKALHDFTGRLAFSWPMDADQYVLNKGGEPYAPLFPLGFGLTLQDSCTLGTLHEHAAQVGKDKLTAFDQGSVRGAWQLLLQDRGGQAPWDDAPLASPEGGVQVRTEDHGRQENAIRVEIEGDGSLLFVHEPFDLTREANAEFFLRLNYWDEPDMPDLDVRLVTAAGETVLEHEPGLPRTLDNDQRFDVSLKRAMAAGADLGSVTGIRIGLKGDGSFLLVRASFRMVTG
ncbi:MAG: glycoside hydrolase family 3 C-terminal domain-containing protein [Hyphomonas sp.]|nr:glycoside hydrolase family 3 C-terminal domain-containing protein [Hyphomonas sp.]